MTMDVEHIEEFVIGLTVYLKSGSPEMTVRGIGEPPAGSEVQGLIQCVWIVDGHVESGDFPAGCLQLSFPGTQGFRSHDLSPNQFRG
jgi:uncharacterized protein YodC (DUF2158 family)